MVGAMRKTTLSGTALVEGQIRLNATAFNLLYLANLLKAVRGERPEFLEFLKLGKR